MAKRKKIKEIWPTKGQAAVKHFLFTNDEEMIHILHPLSGWWFQPIWKILVKLETFP